jgi:hypothetical protein
MRPWAHESEMVKYIDSQRAMTRARTPSTPTYPSTSTMGLPEDDSRQIEELTAALRNLKLRIGQNQELGDRVGEILDYLTELRKEFPIQSPERAFGRLQPLRQMVFWIPPLILHPGESDLAALTLLSHLYATALVVEGLFPEIGDAYMGAMCLPPLERIHEILQTRRSQQPQDSGCQVALQILEYPMRVASSYRQRQRAPSVSYETYRHSPHASPYPGAHGTIASPSETSSTLYSQSPLQTPQSLGTGLNYFPGSQSMPTRRDSPGLRNSGIGDRSASAGSGMSMSMVYAQAPPSQVRSSHESNPSRMEYFGQPQPQQAYSYYPGITTQNRFVTPSQVWT